MSSRSAPTLATLRRWHRRAGIVACLGILAWTLSGSLHPFLSRYQPRPATSQAPAPVTPAKMLTVGEVLARHGLERLARARVVHWDGRARLQIITAEGARRYFDAVEGTEIVDGDAAYARHLARHYLGDARTPIVEVREVRAFDAEYTWVNRWLPAWRVEFARDDHLRVYIDTTTDALVTLVDARKAAYTRWFMLFHNARLFGDGEVPRVPLALLFVASGFLATVLGATLAWRTRGATPRGARRAHRVLAGTVGLMLACSTASGTLHLVKGVADRAADAAAPRLAWPPFAASALDTRWPRVASAATLFAVAGQPCLRMQAPNTGAMPAHAAAVGHDGHAGHEAGPSAAHAAPSVAWTAAGRGACPRDDHQYAFHLATAFAEQPRREAMMTLTNFGGEYGFINKLLPVVRVQLADGARLYLHPDSATRAARVTQADYAEGWLFANLHKWQWLEFIGRWPRDVVMIIFALGGAAAALAGLCLFIGRAR